MPNPTRLLFRAIEESAAAVEAALEAGADVRAMDGGEHVVGRHVLQGMPESRNFIRLNEAQFYSGTCWFTPLHWAVDRSRTAAVEILLGAGADVDAADGDGYTPLHWAAAGHVAAEIVEILLRAGANVDARSTRPLRVSARLIDPLRCGAPTAFGSGRLAPLHWAAWMNNTGAARMLLDGGADVETTDSDGHTPLSYAAMSGGATMVEMLVRERADVDAMSLLGATAVRLAVAGNHKRTVEILLAAGADVNHRPPWCDGVLPNQVVQDVTDEIVELLVRAGADVGDKEQEAGDVDGFVDTRGRTPLHRAARRNAAADLENLLASGAEIEAPDDGGSTALHVAAAAGAGDAIEILVDAGANVGSEDAWGWTPLHRALSSLPADGLFGFGLGWRDFAKLRNRRGQTWLHLAARYARHDVLRRLLPVCLASGGDGILDGLAPDADGRSPLHLGAATGATETVRLLLAAGAELDGVDRTGRTPMHLAVTAPEFGTDVSAAETVRMLLAAGADPDRVDAAGATPLDAARKSGAERAARVLAAERSPGWPLAVADIDSVPKDAEQLLFLAARHNAASTIAALADHGADLEAKDEHGDTALLIAVSRNAVHAIRALVAAGADLDAVGRNNWPALWHAISKGRPEAVGALLDAGASWRVVGGWNHDGYEEARHNLRELGDITRNNFTFPWMTSAGRRPILEFGKAKEHYHWKDADGRIHREYFSSRRERVRFSAKRTVRLVANFNEQRGRGESTWARIAVLAVLTDAIGWPDKHPEGVRRYSDGWLRDIVESFRPGR